VTTSTAHEPAIASWEALGTSAVLALADRRDLDARDLAHARSIVEHELDAVDRACSRFRSDSELSRVNAHAGRLVGVEPLLIEAVEVALRAAELTDGDVDPTVGAALELTGYDRDWRLLARPRMEEQAGPEQPTPPAPRVRATVRAGWQTVELNRAQTTIRIPAGVKLDLGATAKAWAADRASRAVNDASGHGVLVSLGGDVSTCGPSPKAGWQIHVTDDHRSGPGAPGQRIVIRGGGLATSSTAARRWRHQGRTMHHIIDPATGLPTCGPWRTVSVAAIDCADANIATTAALVRGEDAPAWLAELGVPARLVSHDGEVLRIGSWPEEADSR
jgi:thiamine biosynthesis lipoprotein ApbE